MSNTILIVEDDQRIASVVRFHLERESYTVHHAADGDKGLDLLRGGNGNDNIRGFAGFDVLIGGTGNDRLQGDANADTFVFGNGFGHDVIVDFDAFNARERIDLSAVTAITSFADLAADHLTQVGTDAVITDGSNTITITGVDIADLDAGDFLI